MAAAIPSLGSAFSPTALVPAAITKARLKPTATAYMTSEQISCCLAILGHYACIAASAELESSELIAQCKTRMQEMQKVKGVCQLPSKQSIATTVKQSWILQDDMRILRNKIAESVNKLKKPVTQTEKETLVGQLESDWSEHAYNFENWSFINLDDELFSDLNDADDTICVLQKYQQAMVARRQAFEEGMQFLHQVQKRVPTVQLDVESALKCVEIFKKCLKLRATSEASLNQFIYSSFAIAGFQQVGTNPHALKFAKLIGIRDAWSTRLRFGNTLLAKYDDKVKKFEEMLASHKAAYEATTELSKVGCGEISNCGMIVFSHSKLIEEIVEKSRQVRDRNKQLVLAMQQEMSKLEQVSAKLNSELVLASSNSATGIKGSVTQFTSDALKVCITMLEGLVKQTNEPLLQPSNPSVGQTNSQAPLSSGMVLDFTVLAKASAAATAAGSH